jgi:hypothetical protein
MKKKLVFSFLTGILLVLFTATIALADKPTAFDPNGNEVSWSTSGCTTIQSGLITDSTGYPITTGYDKYGYNYQAHMFNGTYDSVDRVLDGKYFGQTADWVDDSLIMKWSDEWISNVDCNND